MNKYSELSDFDINEKIAISKGATDYDGQVRARGIAYTDKNGREAYSDWCNNWSDAGPLMAENGISLTKVNKNLDEWIAKAWPDYSPSLPTHSALNDNPCRAIAECYLMMTNGEKQ